MAPRFKIIDGNGRESLLEDVHAVVQALRDGVITPSSMLFDAQQERWLRADQHDAIQAAIAAFGRQSSVPPEPSTLTTNASDVVHPGHSSAGHDHATQPERDTILNRLRAYVGPRWASHYQNVFSRLLAARLAHTRAGWTWNWSAALCSFYWFLYRRLYFAFFGFLALAALITVLDKMPTGSSEGTTKDVLIFLLSLGLFTLQGFVADRLLFKKAYSVVTDPATPDDPARFEALGRPHNWIIKDSWLPRPK